MTPDGRNANYFFDSAFDAAYCGLQFTTCSFCFVNRRQPRVITREGEGLTHGA